MAKGSLKELWRSLVSDPKHGPLPVLLLGLTVVTGLVDAVSILALGRVFVANMTGNVVFIGFALAGAPGFSLAASLAALAGFLAGALAGGVLVGRYGQDRAVLLRNVAAAEFVLVGLACTGSVVAASPLGGTARDAIAAVSAVGLGLQNGMVRKLAVPDLTTTVLTMTLTGLAADVRGQGPVVLGRRLLAVATMLGGAAVGAVLVLRVSSSAALGLAATVLAVVTVTVALAGRRPAPWRGAGA